MALKVLEMNGAIRAAVTVGRWPRCMFRTYDRPARLRCGKSRILGIDAGHKDPTKSGQKICKTYHMGNKNAGEGLT